MYSLKSAALQNGYLDPINCAATTFISPSADLPFSTAFAVEANNAVSTRAQRENELINLFPERLCNHLPEILFTQEI